jgi:molecular chaperone HscB
MQAVSHQAERRCGRCGAVAPGVVCPACEAVQPLPSGADHFSVLGLPRRLAVDPGALEARWHALARAVHPDRFQTGTDAEQRLSVQASAAVNRAYRTLRDPVARGRYWLELHGMRLAARGPAVPPALAAEVFETQETLEALRAAGDGSAADALRADVRRLRDDLAGRLDAMREALLALYDAGDADGPEALEALRERLAAIAYLRTLLGDLEDATGEGLRGTHHRH